MPKLTFSAVSLLQNYCKYTSQLPGSPSPRSFGGLKAECIGALLSSSRCAAASALRVQNVIFNTLGSLNNMNLGRLTDSFY